MGFSQKLVSNYDDCKKHSYRIGSERILNCSVCSEKKNVENIILKHKKFS